MSASMFLGLSKPMEWKLLSFEQRILVILPYLCKMRHLRNISHIWSNRILGKNISKLVQFSSWHWLHNGEESSPVFLHPYALPHAVLHPHYTSYLVQQDCQSPQEPIIHPCPANTMHMLIFHYIAIVEQCGTHGTVMQHCLEAVFVTQIRWITLMCWWACCTWWSGTHPGQVVALLHTDSEEILTYPL